MINPMKSICRRLLHHSTPHDDTIMHVDIPIAIPLNISILQPQSQRHASLVHCCEANYTVRNDVRHGEAKSFLTQRLSPWKPRKMHIGRTVFDTVLSEISLEEGPHGFLWHLTIISTHESVE